jgi:hypothetical protein
MSDATKALIEALRTESAFLWVLEPSDAEATLANSYDRIADSLAASVVVEPPC